MSGRRCSEASRAWRKLPALLPERQRFCVYGSGGGGRYSSLATGYLPTLLRVGAAEYVSVNGVEHTGGTILSKWHTNGALQREPFQSSRRLWSAPTLPVIRESV